MSSSEALTPDQTHALFDILTHHETYAEIEGFKSPHAVTSYGFPFARITVAVPPQQSGWKTWSSTPVTPVASRPVTPRARTPVSIFRSAAKSKNPEPEEDTQAEDEAGPSTSPLLQMLLSKFVIGLPGVKDLPRDFWSVRIQGLLVRFGEADLSESYDKGAMGTRKMLSTGSSGLIEMVGRGALGGVKRKSPQTTKDDHAKASYTYDLTKAEDLTRAWDDVVEDLVYGDLVDKMFDYFGETDDLEAYSPAIKAAAQYAIIHLSTFLHHIFVHSPEGQYLLKLLENIHNLVPYKMIKQTLRLGNATVMISAMMRLLLAKMSVTSITNWVGLTANADDGMNLLQRIISMVLSWDSGEFRKGADKIERAKDRPTDEMLQAIRDHIAQGRDEHETVRAASAEHAQSIITAIFNASNPDLNANLAEEKHTQCLEYYSALLSIRDRERITATLCRQPPDLFTATVKDVFTASEPIMRSLHSNLNRQEHFEAYEKFIDDFIKTGKPKKDETDTGATSGWRWMRNGESKKPEKMPSVEDYVDLLTRNRMFLYNLIHSVAKSCPDVWEEMRRWCKDAMLEFHQERKYPGAPKEADAKTSGADNDAKVDTEVGKEEADVSIMEDRLNGLFQALPEPSRQPILTALNAHSSYLSSLSALSQVRLQRIVDSSTCDSDSSSSSGCKSNSRSSSGSRSKAKSNPSSGSRPGSSSSSSTSSSCTSSASPASMNGPGMYLSKWQSLLNCTPITPGVPKGPLRCGKDVKENVAIGKSVADAQKARDAAIKSADEGPEAPNVDIVVHELGDGFRKLLQEVEQQ
ncbi:hypothetical protein B0T10DRAFT_482314 [Thelonectria olida]|uniref:Uncharacterized protein n=1 Tax=Thelonectria olida TaxID=1576542 RepID=A0A9P8W9U1_9HYPO|nr:hypothetical protein B0T10DRAFT_482314 [Thelonectria olida]